MFTWRRLGTATMAGSIAVLGVAVAAPARAADGLNAVGNYSCSIYAGLRGGDWIVTSSVPEVGTLTAISASPASAAHYMTAIGSNVGGNSTASIEFGDSTGGSSISFSATVHWSSRSDGGPLDVTVTGSLHLNPCLPKPKAQLTSNCDGSVTALLSNGEYNNVYDSGGTATFDVSAANGFNRPNIGVNLASQATVTIPAADASSVTVTADNGMTPVSGAYTPAPGCVGYAASGGMQTTSASSPATGGRSGSGIQPGAAGQGTSASDVGATASSRATASGSAAGSAPGGAATPGASGAAAAVSVNAGTVAAVRNAEHGGESVWLWTAVTVAVLALGGGFLARRQLLRRRPVKADDEGLPQS